MKIFEQLILCFVCLAAAEQIIKYNENSNSLVPHHSLPVYRCQCCRIFAKQNSICNNTTSFYTHCIDTRPAHTRKRMRLGLHENLTNFNSNKRTRDDTCFIVAETDGGERDESVIDAFSHWPVFQPTKHKRRNDAKKSEEHSQADDHSYDVLVQRPFGSVFVVAKATWLEETSVESATKPPSNRGQRHQIQRDAEQCIHHRECFATRRLRC